MVDLALLSRSGPVTLAVLGERQRISKSYLDQLFGKLRRRALVRSTRGPGGGYSLGRDAGLISVADIILAVDQPSRVTTRTTMATGSDQGTGHGLTRDLWAGLNAKLIEWLHAISLESLVDERIARGTSIDRMPIQPGPAARANGRPSIGLGIAPRPVHETVQPRVPNSVFALGLP